MIDIEIHSEERNSDYSFRKQMLGFCDSVFGYSTPPPIKTSFVRWRKGDPFGEELLDETIFFNVSDFEKVDHSLDGSVDPFGQFKGTLRVYDKIYNDISVPWANETGQLTTCGPFKISFGYLSGRVSESMLTPEEFAVINPKLDHLGGMYVYRDRIRILPYGDHSFDWLDVEKRRNKGAGYYFFSFRRMFGAVILTRDKNAALEEKAGREGFQQNQAYRQLRDILMNLLIQLAAEFFRQGGTYTETFEKSQEELRKKSEALERQRKLSNEKRKALASDLKTFNEAIQSKLPGSEVNSLRTRMAFQMSAASRLNNQDEAAAALIRAEREALSSLEKLRQRYSIRKPAGVALTKDLSRDWEIYQSEMAKLESELFGTFADEIQATLGDVAKQAKLYIDQRKRLEDRLASIADERRRQLAEASRMANDSAADTRQTVLTITERAKVALNQTINDISADLNRVDLNSVAPDKLDEMRIKWEEQLNSIESSHRESLMAARDMLASLAENLKAGETPALLMEALEEKMLAMEEQADSDFEMVQLGLAVAIINHEFSAAIQKVRKGVKDLGSMSRKSEGLQPIYNSIRNNFEHLDGHLNLFTPLQRRLHRQPQQITGHKIARYVDDLFANRFSRHKVNIEYTPAFLNTRMECYQSTLYPAIINIIDNGLYWLTSIKGSRQIRLDAESSTLIILNNGPQIEERDRKHLFDRGFSRKPSGRGLGLFISSKALSNEGMTLSVETPPPGFGVSFHIRIPNLQLN